MDDAPSHPPTPDPAAPAPRVDRAPPPPPTSPGSPPPPAPPQAVPQAVPQTTIERAVKPGVPATAPSTADRFALAAVWTLPALGLMLKLIVPGWMVLFHVPVVFAFVTVGLPVFVLTFRRRSAVRAAIGFIPRRFHALAWSWAVALMLPGLVIVDGGDTDDWTSPLLVIMGLGDQDVPHWHDFVQGPVSILAGLVAIGATIATWVLYVRYRRRRPT